METVSELRFIKEVYFGKSLEKRSARILTDLKERLFFPPRHLILAPVSAEGRVEIVSSLQLYQPLFPFERYRVAGVAASKGEALELLQRIAAEALEAENTGDLADYLRKKP